MDEQTPASRIRQINDAPPPTPDPWRDDAPDLLRCAFCATSNPGSARCRSCRKALIIRRRPGGRISLTLTNLFVVALGRGPLLLAITFLFEYTSGTLISPLTIYLALSNVLLVVVAAGLLLRLRLAWYGLLAVTLVDIIVQIGFRLLLGTPLPLFIAGLLSGLIILTMAMAISNEVAITEEAIALPPRQAWPKQAIDAFNHGADYAEAGQWYLAARLWQHAVNIAPHEWRYRRALGNAYMHLRKYASANAELRAAAALNPDDEQTRRMLQWLENM